jgi:hypothetical protein
VSASWSESQAYTGVTIDVLVDSSLGGTPAADAYLTTRIGPGTTAADEIAHTQFTVPEELPVCSPSGNCGAMVTLFSGLSLGPGNYFLTLGSTATSGSVVGWFPALNPVVIEDTGVTQGPSYLAGVVDPFAPASPFGVYPFAMNFTVTGTPVPVPEPAETALVGLCVLFLLLIRYNRKMRRGSHD